MLRRLFSLQAQSPSPNPRLASQLPVFSNADTVATIIDNITDLPTLCNFASVFPVARLVFVQYPRPILLHTTSNDMVLAFVASTEYQVRGQHTIDLFLKQFVDEGCSNIPRLSNHNQVLESLSVIDDAIENFSAFLQTVIGSDPVQSYKMGVEPGLVSYLSNMMVARYTFPFHWDSSRDRAKQALWVLEIYKSLFLSDGGASYVSSSKNLMNQAHYLHRLDSELFWTLDSICTHFRQTLKSPTLHHTQHRLYEILKMGHGLTRSQGMSSDKNRGFFEKHLAYQLSLALPEMLRVFHHQWSGYLQGPVPDAPDDGTNRPSPREVFQQRREEWTLLSGSDAYEELDEAGEAAFMSMGFNNEGPLVWCWLLTPFIFWGCLLWAILS